MKYPPAPKIWDDFVHRGSRNDFLKNITPFFVKKKTFGLDAISEGSWVSKIVHGAPRSFQTPPELLTRAMGTKNGVPIILAIQIFTGIPF